MGGEKKLFEDYWRKIGQTCCPSGTVSHSKSQQCIPCSDKPILKYIDIDIDNKGILQNIDIDKAILKNIDINIDKEILENINIDKISN